MRRRLTALVAMVVVAVMLVAGPAFAAPSSNASCVGLGSSSVGQAQTRDEAAHDIKEQAEEEGTTPGAFVSSVAKQHLGSEEACFGEGE